MSETKIDSLIIEISTDSENAGANIDLVTAALNRLKGSNSSLNKSTKSLSKLSRAIKGIAHSGVSIALGKAVNSINSYVENVNLFTVSMGKYATEAMAYAERVQEAMGVDSSEFMRNQAIFMNMAEGFGLAQDEAYQLSKGMTELAYDISSLYNADIEEVFQRLQSGIAGEIEPVRRWGIALDQASMKQWLLKEGIDANVSSLTQADKALVRYNMMVEAMSETGAIGDFARTLETPANAIRILQQRITQLSRAIGTLLIPIISKVIPYIQAFVKVVTEAAQALANLFGINIDFNVDYSGLTDSAGAVSDSFDDALDSAKKLKNYVMGFDELNVISPTDSSSADTAAASNLGLDVASVWDEAIFAGIESQVESLTGRMKVLFGVVVAVGGALALWRISSSIQGALKGVYGVLYPIVGMLSGSAMVPTATQSGIIGLLAKVSKYAKPIGIVVGVVTALGLAFVDLWKNSETFRDAVSNVWLDIKRSASDAFSTIDESIGNVLAIFGIAVGDLSNAYGTYIRPIVEAIGTLFVNVFGVVITTAIDLFAESFKLVSGVIVGLITGDWTQAIEGFSGVMSTILPDLTEKVKETWADIKSWFNSTVAPKLTLEYWMEKFVNVKESFVTTIKNAINSAIDLVNKFIKWLNDRMTFSWDAFEIAGKQIVPAGSIQLFTIPYIPQFKDGGFIEDGLFTMNHGEIAGKFNNGKSVVANNEQIIEGIAQGVYEAFMRANSDSGERPVQVDVYLDSKQITSTVNKKNDERGRTIMGNALGYNY